MTADHMDWDMEERTCVRKNNRTRDGLKKIFSEKNFFIL
jgi:hypothetical protein